MQQLTYQSAYAQITSILILIILFSAKVQCQFWEQTLPEPDFYSCVEYKGDLYGALITGVYVSTDRGEIWRNIHIHDEIQVVKLLVVLKGDLYAITDSRRFFKMAADGESWEEFFPDDFEQYSRVDGYVQSGDEVFLRCGGGVYKSLDMKNWELISDNMEDGGSPFIHYLESEGDELIAASSDSRFIYYSSDRGENWKNVKGNLPDEYLFSCWVNNANLFAVMDNNIYRSTNFGESWERKDNNIEHDNSSPYYIGRDGEKVFITSDFVIYSTTDNGETWEFVNDLDPGYKNVLYVFDDFYLLSGYVSYDKGLSWEKSGNGYEGGDFVKTMLTMDKKILACNETGILVSEDFARTWEQLSLPGFCADCDFNIDGNSIYATNITKEASYARLFRSNDLGASWEELDAALNSETSGFVIADGEYILYLVRIHNEKKYSVYKSDDGGKSWDKLEIYSLGEPGRIFKSDYYWFICDMNGKIARSDDYGVTWEFTTELNMDNEGEYTLTVIQAKGADLFIGFQYQYSQYGIMGVIYHSPDNGDTWEIRGDSFSNYTSCVGISDNELFIASSTNVFVSDYSVDNIKIITYNLPDASVSAIVKLDGYYYALLSQKNGVYWLNEVFANKYKETPHFLQDEQINIFPNPVADIAEIKYYLEKASNVRITITDQIGRIVDKPFNGSIQAGENSYSLDTEKLARGIYFIYIHTAEEVLQGKMDVL